MIRLKTWGLMLLLSASFCASSTLLFGSSPERKDTPGFFRDSIRVDGNVTDWGESSFYYNSDAGVLYAFGNDSSALILCFRVMEDSQQMALFQAGFDLCIDLTGKKKQDVVITLPKGNMPSPGTSSNMGSKMDREENMTRKEKDMQRMMLPKYLVLKGFRDGINGNQPVSGETSGILFGMAHDSIGALNFEISIPFSAFRDSLMTDQELTFGLILKAAQRPQGPPAGEGGMGMPSHGMDRQNSPGGQGGPPQGMRPGGNMGDPGNSGTEGKEHAFWQKMRIMQ